MSKFKKIKTLIKSEFKSFYRTKIDKRPILLVYQMGKVASSSINYSAKLAKKHSVYQVHRLDEGNIERMNTIFTAKNVKIETSRHHRQFYRAKLNPAREQIKIVTLVREPISRNCSAYFENLDRIYRAEEAHNGKSKAELIEKFFAEYSHEIPLEWFDYEFKPVTGIDVFEHPFNQEEGFSVIKEGVYEVLILHHDLADDKKESLLKDFLELDHFELKNQNVSSDKSYADKYKEFMREVKFPTEYLDQMLNSKYTTHFYSPDKIASIKAKRSNPE